MDSSNQIVFDTERLAVQIATEADAGRYYELWTNPQVMANVGFPQGLRTTRETVRRKLAHDPDSEFDRRLAVELKENGDFIGECKLARPDEEGVVEPDIKLLPEYWGQRYGSELWRALVRYEFTHTDCSAVQTTPDMNNTAAIRMYKAAGAVREGEHVFVFPPEMADFTR